MKRTFPKPIAISSNVLLDRERCVLCQRCTRFSEQIAGDPFIDLLERGAQQQIGTVDRRAVPVLLLRQHRADLPGRRAHRRVLPLPRPPVRPACRTDSVCEHCSSGCAQRTDWRRGKVTRRLAGDDPEVNEEWNCDKGRWAFHYADAARPASSTPLVRDEHGDLVETSWPEALERAAAGPARGRDRGGVGVLPGGRLTEEDAYAYAKFARVALGTNDIDFRARPVSAEELAFLGAHVAGVTPEHVVLRGRWRPRRRCCSPASSPRRSRRSSSCGCASATRLGRTQGLLDRAAGHRTACAKLDGTLLPDACPAARPRRWPALDAAVVDAL